jgi:hypothetical protein
VASFLNELSPTLLSELGREIDFNAVFPKKADEPIVFNPKLKSTASKLIELRKALSPMLLKELGRDNLYTFEFPENASSPMSVTPSGIITAPSQVLPEITTCCLISRQLGSKAISAAIAPSVTGIVLEIVWLAVLAEISMFASPALRPKTLKLQDLPGASEAPHEVELSNTEFERLMLSKLMFVTPLLVKTTDFTSPA